MTGGNRARRNIDLIHHARTDELETANWHTAASAQIVRTLQRPVSVYGQFSVQNQNTDTSYDLHAHRHAAPRDSFCLYGSEILSQDGDPPGHCILGGPRLGGEDSPPYRHILVSVCWKTLCRSETKDPLN